MFHSLSHNTTNSKEFPIPAKLHTPQAINLQIMMRRERDAEAELNLPPGFRFHPTDEELVVHYLCRKITFQTLPVPIIAEVDLYRYNPWQLPDMALFGAKEWYFFTPRDRKYPNGSRPNRSAGSGYWKATGADKPIRPTGSTKHLGIKKALVFYSGKAPKGTKTNWIMHEYRLAEPNRHSNKKGSLRLDDWVLCRLYNKKNNWQTSQNIKEEVSTQEPVDSFEVVGSDSFTTSESDVDNDITQGARNQASASAPQQTSVEAVCVPVPVSPLIPEFVKEDSNEWFMDLKLDDLQNSIAVPMQDVNWQQDQSLLGINSPQFKPYQSNLLPSWGLWTS